MKLLFAPFIIPTRTRTMNQHQEEIVEELAQIMHDPVQIQNIMIQLGGNYQYMAPEDLVVGRYIRWINKKTLRMSTGGILYALELTNRQCKVRVGTRHWSTIVFDQCLFFQKMNLLELELASLDSLDSLDDARVF